MNLCWNGSAVEKSIGATMFSTLRGGQLNLKELRGRAITRDIDWGVAIPLEGYESKRIYVWYDAVQGYLSAAIEWAALSGGQWREWWDRDLSPDAPPLLFYRQGQHSLPHANLAGNDYGL